MSNMQALKPNQISHKGKNWCNGDCYWNDGKSVNRGKAEEDKKQPGCLLKKISCGGHRANSCSKCPFSGNKYKGQNWCNGDCYWNDRKKVNREKAEKNNEQPGCVEPSRHFMKPTHPLYDRDLDPNVPHSTAWRNIHYEDGEYNQRTWRQRSREIYYAYT